MVMGVAFCGHVYACLEVTFARSDMIMILVAPLWPLQDWFSDLLLLLVDEPLKLTMVQLHVRKICQAIDIIRFHAWKLSDDLPERQTFQNKLQRRSQFLLGDLQPEFTRGNGSGFYH